MRAVDKWVRAALLERFRGFGFCPFRERVSPPQPPVTRTVRRRESRSPRRGSHTNMTHFSGPVLKILTAAALVASCSTAPSPTPPTTPSGIPYVDAVIEAVQSGDPQAFKDLFVLHMVPCTTERWLLRQSLCPQGETHGTLVQTLPMLSADLGHLTVDEINSWQGIGEAPFYPFYPTV